MKYLAWIIGIAVVVTLSAFSIRHERQKERRYVVNNALLAWQAECKDPVPVDPLGNAPVGPTAWERSEALLFLEGRGPKPDLSCPKRLLLRPLEEPRMFDAKI